MLLCRHFLGKILHVVQTANSDVPYLYFQKLCHCSTKILFAQTYHDAIRLVSSANQGAFMSKPYSLRNCHTSVQEKHSKTVSNDEQKKSVQTMAENIQIPEEKVKIYFETVKGEKIECIASTKQNVMNASIENDIAMHGNCSGEAICSVCHVYIDEKYQEFMPKISEEEAEMLDMVPNFQENSRLSCQINIRKELEGAVFKLPHYDGPSYFS